MGVVKTNGGVVNKERAIEKRMIIIIIVAVYGLVDGSQYYPGNQCSPGEMTAGIPSGIIKI